MLHMNSTLGWGQKVWEGVAAQHVARALKALGSMGTSVLGCHVHELICALVAQLGEHLVQLGEHLVQLGEHLVQLGEHLVETAARVEQIERPS